MGLTNNVSFSSFIGRDCLRTWKCRYSLFLHSEQFCISSINVVIKFSSFMQVVTTLDGDFIVQIGSTGEEGLQDGSFDDATFNRPQVIYKRKCKNAFHDFFRL